jgi:hypothetical protein
VALRLAGLMRRFEPCGAGRRAREGALASPAVQCASLAIKASARRMIASSTSSFRMIGRSRSDSLTAAAKAQTRSLAPWLPSIDQGAATRLLAVAVRFGREVASVFMAMH